MKKFFFIVLIAAFCACQPEISDLQKQVELCATAPEAITSSACFTLNGKGYIFGGRITQNVPHTFSNRIYCYDPQTDQWSDLGAAPLKERVRPRAVVVGNDVYLGLGFNGHVLADSAYLDDWWRWSPATNTWTQLATYPCNRTVGPVIATDGRYIYAADGGSQNFERWIFRYDIANDRWTQVADGLPRMADYPPRAHSASGAMSEGRFFIGAGYTREGSSDFWCEAELSADTVVWQKRAPLSGKRHNAVAVSCGSYIYVGGGHLYGGTVTTGRLYDDILRYDTSKDEWIRIGHLPDGERENMSSWVIDGVLYMGLGNDKRDKPCSQLYRIRL